MYRIKMRMNVIVTIESNDDTSWRRLELFKKELQSFKPTTPGVRVVDAFTDAMLSEETYNV